MLSFNAGLIVAQILFSMIAQKRPSEVQSPTQLIDQSAERISIMSS